MPVKKYTPPKPYWAPTKILRAARVTPPSSPPVLVPISTPTPPPSSGAFSNAFSNAFDI